jgi:hypothetical protein
MFALARCFLLSLPALWLGGCHNPARQNVPQAENQQQENGWREELVPGLKADRALAYLLTHGFECQVTRDENARVLRIVASRPGFLREASGAGRNGQIDLAIQEDLIQAVKITPLSVSR